MAYEGIIKKSRTYDLTAVSQAVDAGMGAFLLYSPESIGVSVPTYMAIRVVLNVAAVYLRSVTKGPVGDK